MKFGDILTEDKPFKTGSVKESYAVKGADQIIFKFTDGISVFDKIIPSEIPYKGETLCRTGTYWFGEAESLGYLTHFVCHPTRNTMLVKKVNIIKDYSQLNTKKTNYLIPIEFICRWYNAGSLNDRFVSGEIKPEQVGLDHIPEYGEKLPEPFFETTTKFEEYDRKLSNEEAIKIAGLTQEEFDAIREAVIEVDEHINSSVAQRGLIHVDGKKEFAFNEDRELMLVDLFGTADEDRFWDAKKYEEGKFVEMSKEFVRQHYRRIGYYEQLEDRRKLGGPEPPIPALPDDMIKEASEIYISLFEKITGDNFRESW